MSRLPQPDPECYYLPEDDPLRYAVLSAQMLGKPLLLTGEPGTGKSELAYHLAWEEAGRPKDASVRDKRSRLLRFDTKSTSQARDLFYTYDVMGRFREQQIDTTRTLAQDITRYLKLGPLGVAILRATPPEEVDLDAGTLSRLMASAPGGGSGGARPVVLIDEVDKAPRDFPNDILREIENLEFSIPELSSQVFRARDDHLPFLIFTSNSERDLPDAFLRRCVYHHIQFPTEAETLHRLVRHRLSEEANVSAALLKNAAEDFVALRKELRVVKMPATGEFLDWVVIWQQAFPEHDSPRALLAQSHATGEEARSRTLDALSKTADDQRALREAMNRLWNPPALKTIQN